MTKDTTRRHVESEGYKDTRARCEMTVRAAVRERKRKILEEAESERRHNLPDAAGGRVAAIEHEERSVDAGVPVHRDRRGRMTAEDKMLLTDETQTSMLAALWRPIEELSDKYANNLLLRAPELCSLDFNEHGVGMGYFQDGGLSGDLKGGSWIANRWDGSNDEWRTVECTPTHYIVLAGPTGLPPLPHHEEG